MNLLLFEPGEVGQPLRAEDERYRHLTKVLSISVGERFDMGIVNGKRGKGLVTLLNTRELQFSFQPLHPCSTAHNLYILLPFIRPVNGQRVLRELSTLGAAQIVQFTAEKSEKSYAQSKYYRAEKVRALLKEGAEQAFCTNLPSYYRATSLQEAIGHCTTIQQKIAFDNYEATVAYGNYPFREGGAAVLAIGPERGWSAQERNLLRSTGFILASLGVRVLRAETATLSAVILSLQKMGKL